MPGDDRDRDEQRRYFSVDEANALVPELETRFRRILKRVGQAREITSYLSSLGGAHPGALRGELRRVYAEIQLDVEAVQAHGCVIKDMSSGLVDFWHRREADDVLLCWKLGEAAVHHWHDPDTGFSGRKPLLEDPAADVDPVVDPDGDEDEAEELDLEEVLGIRLLDDDDDDGGDDDGPLH